MIYNDTATEIPGATRVTRFTTGYFWRGPADRPDRLDPAAIAWPHVLDLVRQHRGRPFVINIEGTNGEWTWERPGDSPAVLEQWVDLARTVRRVHGGDVGIFRIVPEAAYWQPIRYCKGADPERDNYYWRLRNNRLFRLAEEVTTIYPQIYLQDSDHYRKNWACAVDANIREALQYGKPVRPYTSPQYRGSHREPFAPVDEWVRNLELIKAAGVDDITLYMDNKQEIPAEYLAPAVALFGFGGAA